jgi:hypothetical protein
VGCHAHGGPGIRGDPGAICGDVYTGTAPGNDAGETNSASVISNLFVSGTTTNLIVTLTNTALYKPNDPPDILTAKNSIAGKTNPNPKSASSYTTCYRPSTCTKNHALTIRVRFAETHAFQALRFPKKTAFLAGDGGLPMPKN